MSKRPQKRQRRAILDERSRLHGLLVSVFEIEQYVRANVADSSSSKARMLEDLACLHGMVLMDLQHSETALAEIEAEIEPTARPGTTVEVRR